MPHPPTIGFVAENLSDAYIGGLLAGVAAVTRRSGVGLLTFQGLPRDVATSRVARDHVAGWIAPIFTSAPIYTEGLHALTQQGVPLVTIAAHAPGVCPAVLADNHGGAYAEVCHLIDHGHRRIAFAGWMVFDDVMRRYA